MDLAMDSSLIKEHIATCTNSSIVNPLTTAIGDMLFRGTEQNQCGIFSKMLKRGTDILSLQYNARCTHKLVCKIVDVYLS